VNASDNTIKTTVLGATPGLHVCIQRSQELCLAANTATTASSKTKTRANMECFIRHHLQSTEDIGNVYEKYIGTGLPVAVLFLDVIEKDQNEYAIAELTKVAETFKGKVLFMHGDGRQYNKTYLSELGGDPTDRHQEEGANGASAYTIQLPKGSQFRCLQCVTPLGRLPHLQ
jgi:hypothetical protein